MYKRPIAKLFLCLDEGVKLYTSKKGIPIWDAFFACIFFN